MTRTQSVSVFVLQQFRKVFGARGDYELREVARKLQRQIKGGLLNEQASGLLNGFSRVIRAFRSESMGLGETASHLVGI